MNYYGEVRSIFSSSTLPQKNDGRFFIKLIENLDKLFYGATIDEHFWVDLKLYIIDLFDDLYKRYKIHIKENPDFNIGWTVYHNGSKNTYISDIFGKSIVTASIEWHEFDWEPDLECIILEEDSNMIKEINEWASGIFCNYCDNSTDEEAIRKKSEESIELKCIIDLYELHQLDDFLRFSKICYLQCAYSEDNMVARRKSKNNLSDKQKLHTNTEMDKK